MRKAFGIAGLRGGLLALTALASSMPAIAQDNGGWRGGRNAEGGQRQQQGGGWQNNGGGDRGAQWRAQAQRPDGQRPDNGGGREQQRPQRAVPDTVQRDTPRPAPAAQVRPDGAGWRDRDNGRPGNDGRPGNVGRPDNDGRPGNIGRPDYDGRPGNAGRPGNDGRPGNIGRPDNDGRPGYAGRPDNDGRPGNVGRPGNDGRPGYVGRPGNDGRPGNYGRPGNAGRPDNDGRPGNIGRPGNNGNWNDNRGGSGRLNASDRWRDQRRWDNNSWRRDNRYDWSRYRQANRDRYRLPAYRPPSGWSYGYRSLSIGLFLGSPLFASSYWLDDPWSYRLPPAYGTLRWVRYYDDALLVDVRDGYVVDVIRNFFW
ncbi:MAG: RcnB family protein [Sphingobium sp.]